VRPFQSCGRCEWCLSLQSRRAISEIASANDAVPLPGQPQATTFVPNLSVPVNSLGQVAFGAELGTTSQGSTCEMEGATQKVVANDDSVPLTSATFGSLISIAGLADNGNLAFTAATSAAADGLFLATFWRLYSGPRARRRRRSCSRRGTFSLTPPVPVTPPGPFTIGINFFKNFAAINGESDVAFRSAHHRWQRGFRVLPRLAERPGCGHFAASRVARASSARRRNIQHDHCSEQYNQCSNQSRAEFSPSVLMAPLRS